MAYKRGSPSDLKRQAARKNTTKAKEAAGTDGALHPAVTRVARANVPGISSIYAKGGEYKIAEDSLIESAMTMMSYDSLAIVYKVTPEYLKEHYSKLIELAREQRCEKLRAAQFYNAIELRNVVMQIWLGKQYLNQKDRQAVEQSGPNGGPMQVQRRVVAYIPDNGRDGPKQLPPGTEVVIKES